jgi:acyl carrier protein
LHLDIFQQPPKKRFSDRLQGIKLKGNREMTRDEIESRLMTIFQDVFEFESPGLDDDLRDVHGFDSIDAIELLREIEKMLGSKLSQEEKKGAMDIRTVKQVVDYVEALASARK